MDILTEFLHLFRYRFLLTDYDYRLQPYQQMMDPRPARFLFPVALLPVPTWWQTPCFQNGYPRGQLPWTNSPRDRERSTICVNWNSATTSSRAISASGGSKGRCQGPTQKSAYLWDQQNPGFPWESADFTVDIHNYAEDGKLHLAYL